MTKYPIHSKEYVSLKQYFNIQIKSIYKSIDLKSKLIERSTRLAADSLEKRLDHMNEFRLSLSDQAKTFLTKDEYIIHHEKIQDDIRILRESKSKLEGMTTQKSVTFAYFLSYVAILIGIVEILLHFIH